jgi:predicted metal-dependent hydrolase
VTAPAAPPSQLDLFAAAPVAGSLSIRRSPRAKRLSVRVFPHGHAEVVVPFRTRDADVRAFIAASQAWIERTRLTAIEGGASADISLPACIDLPAAGERWQVDYSAPGTGDGLRAESATGGGRLRLAATDAEARKLLRRWLVESARRVLPPLVERLAGTTGLAPAAVSIRRQRTRWGSCTARRWINLNCAALFLPPPLVEYLIIHELCHLRHMNHSRRFWGLVESFVPDFQGREAGLATAWNSVPGWVFYGP